MLYKTWFIALFCKPGYKSINMYSDIMLFYGIIYIFPDRISLLAVYQPYKTESPFKKPQTMILFS